jgi:methionyl-tRNA formyltransferase
MSEPLRIAFAGTPEFARVSLDAVAASRHRLVGVWTQPDRPAGRGRTLTASPVKDRAIELGLPVHQPATLKRADARHDIEAARPDVMVVVAYGLILPAKVLAIPRYGCLNVHASLLPRWRGAAPIQRALLAGDAETGVAIMQMDEGLDTGDVLARHATPIGAEEDAQGLHDRLAALGAAALLEVLDALPDVERRPQGEAGASYAGKLSKAEARLDWHRPAGELARCVRAYRPWPVAHTLYKGEPLRVWRATVTVSEGVRAEPGTVLGAGREGVDVAAGSGVLRLLEVQSAGGRVQAAADFANGRDLRVRLG